ncbi:MAG TPA: dihydrodipicolinate synthase family protein, partial [Synergistetes bacterium]|nr:dihydrodipicolinate synthase family protein [Synergistota bacterium]
GQNSPESLEKFFFDIADISTAPVVIYNMPSNTGFNLSAPVVSRISSHANIIGIKDSSADIVQIATICRDAPEGFGVFAGSGSYFLPSLAVGCSGGTMGVANLFAGPCRDIFISFRNGDLDRAKRIQLAMIGINQAVTARFGVPGLKAAMDHAGLYGGPVRPPLMDADERTRNEINGIFEKFHQFCEEGYP